MPDIFLERQQPNSVSTERALLGCIIVDPACFHKINPSLRSEHFYSEANKLIYQQIEHMFDVSQALDTVTLVAELKNKGLLNKVGGVSYILDLCRAIATSANVAQYSDMVVKYATLRKMIVTTAEVMEKAYTASDRDLSEFIAEAESMIFAVGGQDKSEGLRHIYSTVWNYYESIDIKSDSPRKAVISTGFLDLDSLLSGGFIESSLIILAARPSMGKTALAVFFLITFAKIGYTSAFFSLEMGAEEIVARAIAVLSGVNANNARTKSLGVESWKKLADAAAELSDLPIFIDESSTATLSEVASRCKRLKEENPDLMLIVVDYLQLIEAPNKAEKREQQVAQISRGLKRIAKELKVIIIALSQLSRSVESRQDKRPMLSDLRESGGLEQDADLVMFIYRDEYYNPNTSDKKVAELIIAKNRNGSTGTVKTFFEKELTRFSGLGFEPTGSSESQQNNYEDEGAPF